MGERNSKQFPINLRRDKQGSDYENMLCSANELKFVLGKRKQKITFLNIKCIEKNNRKDKRKSGSEGFIGKMISQ